MILVTGATGTVGRQVVESLRSKGVPVRAGLRDIEKGGRLWPHGVEWAKLDFDQPESLAKACEGIRKVFYVSPFSPDMAEQTGHLVQQALKSGVTHIVRLSVYGADEEKPTALQRGHRDAERLIEESGLAYTFLRPNSFMENFIHHHGAAIRSQNQVFMPMGKGRVSYVAVRDIADAAAEVLTSEGHAGKSYTLTGPQALDGRDVALALSEALGRSIVFTDIPEDTARAAMSMMPRWLVDALLELQAACKVGKFAEVSESARRLAGRPATPFMNWAREHVEAWVG